VISTSDIAELLPDESEHDRVTRWRLEQFGALGFDLGDSLLLAASPADLEMARKLVRSGCEPEVAAQILL
jgi:hypothetical protein